MSQAEQAGGNPQYIKGAVQRAVHCLRKPQELDMQEGWADGWIGIHHGDIGSHGWNLPEIK
jgi:hypothetical protein